MFTKNLSKLAVLDTFFFIYYVIKKLQKIYKVKIKVSNGHKNILRLVGGKYMEWLDVIIIIILDVSLFGLGYFTYKITHTDDDDE